jgi:hypothetical protein
VKVGLMAGDEYDTSAAGHQGQCQPGQPYLRIAIDPHRISGVGGELQAARSVENEDIHPFEGVRDLAHHCGGGSFIR